jgi:hypothetical protein
MKILLTIVLSLFTLSILAQDKFYTKGLANGFAWTAPPTASMLAYSKGESLSGMLDHRKFQTQIQRDLSFPLGCDAEVEGLLKSKSSPIIDLHTIEKMIDKFYDNQENLVIPVLGAYCCCIKELAEESIVNIEKYRQALLEFSSEKSEQ